MNEQELQKKFQVFERQIIQIQEQLQAVENAIYDMSTVVGSIDALTGKTDEEIMAPIGRGIYVKAKLLEEELMVDVGEKNFVKKSIPETKDLINNQIEKFKEIKNQLEGELDKINTELTNTMMAGQEGHSCGCGHNHEACNDEKCDCENDKEGCSCESCECEKN